MTERKVPFYDIIKTLVLFVVAFTVIIFVSKTINHLFVKKESGPLVIPNTRPVINCPDNFLSYQNLVENPKSVVNLISTSTPMYAENQQFNSKIIITKIETEKSKVACGYLFVSAGTKTNGPLQKWENLYINPNEFGGHINSDNSIGIGDSTYSSTYLFSLSKINYWKNRSERVKGNLLTADWGVLLNVSQQIGFEIGLNTNDTTGFIDRFSIAYKCWNPETGEQNWDCSIKVLE